MVVERAAVIGGRRELQWSLAVWVSFVFGPHVLAEPHRVVVTAVCAH